MTIKECTGLIKEETSKIFVGKDDQISLILMAVFVGGHVLLDDLPGSGKTTLVKTLARALGCGFRRIQFTPDLMPSDITGMTVYDQKSAEFRHVKGPIFTNILLADEINRAIPRTQSALLEAMEEEQVTIDNDTYALPKPFFVLATQNPVERESTFMLPWAQMDRFFVRLSLGFPDKDEEKRILSSLGDEVDLSVVNAVTGPEQLMQMREEIRGVYVSEFVKQYIVDLVQATRADKDLESGASPRASICLYQGGKSLAAMNGRDYVTPEDISQIFLPVLSHRVRLSRAAQYAKRGAEDVLSDILKNTPVPPEGSERFDAAGKK
ncbi:MAG: MoxR family ATPase [Firmicutes bacterium]|nr:MoxR family ATPase [Bacillota bacterium]